MPDMSDCSKRYSGHPEDGLPSLRTTESHWRHRHRAWWENLHWQKIKVWPKKAYFIISSFIISAAPFMSSASMTSHFICVYFRSRMRFSSKIAPSLNVSDMRPKLLYCFDESSTVRISFMYKPVVQYTESPWVWSTCAWVCFSLRFLMASCWTGWRASSQRRSVWRVKLLALMLKEREVEVRESNGTWNNVHVQERS